LLSVDHVCAGDGWNPRTLARSAKYPTRVQMKITGASSASATSTFW